MSALFTLFHLNLAFSAIPVSARDEVLVRCYHPLLDVVARTGIPIGIELSGWTLSEIARRDPMWIGRFKALLSARLCELVGSGYVQLIGPLAPYEVNRANQRLGLEVYEELLDVRPELAMVNEMAFSAGLVDVYLEAGYRGLLVERENLRRALGHPVTGYHRGTSPSGASIPLLFADSLVFQKFQRVVHDQVPVEDLEEYLRRMDTVSGPTALYASDAEVFDFRPRRYDYEEHEPVGEWERIAELLARLSRERKFLRPSEAMAETRRGRAQNIITRDAHYPIPVKKQLKYNLSRWAVTGRDDLLLGTRCHALARATDGDQRADAQFLLESWSSDLRTHIVEERLEAAMAAIEARLASERAEPEKWQPETIPPGIDLVEENRFELRVETPSVKLVLNRRRGLKIKSLAFAAHDFQATVGTLPHGYFEAIDLGADFYSGGVVIESPSSGQRITDLERLPFAVGARGDWLSIRLSLETPFGDLGETIEIHAQQPRLRLGYAFPGWRRPPGTVRLGNITLLPEAFDRERLEIRCWNGGPMEERFALDEPCRHMTAVSSLVSCTTGFGATTGQLTIGDQRRRLRLAWDPARCAAFPMLWHEPSPPSHLTRVIFSLAEFDDTRREGGHMCDFELSIEPQM